MSEPGDDMFDHLDYPNNFCERQPTAERLTELAKRHQLALALDDADPGFRLTADDMRMIEWALSFAARRHGPDWNAVLRDCAGCANSDDNEAVVVTRGTARHALSALRQINEADYYHNNGAAERELRVALSAYHRNVTKED